MAERSETPESTVFGTEEALAKISMELLEPTGKKLMTVTDLTPEEIFGLAYAKRIAALLDSDLMKNWIDDFMMMRISRLRRGRQEFLLLGTGIKEASERRKGTKVGDIFAGLR
jgi:hypothetical protein